jgi:tripartite-type tricarboxylate transporter receptor subunit TctC
VTIVVGYPAGGDTDAAARLYAERLSAKFGQTFLVDTKPGAGGTIAASFVAKARPDGHTLLYTPSNFAIVPHVLKLAPSVAHDVRTDFTPIIKDQNIPLVMVTGSASGIRSIGELVRQARAGQVQSHASPSSGSVMHVLAEMFNRAAGLKLPGAVRPTLPMNPNSPG